MGMLKHRLHPRFCAIHPLINGGPWKVRTVGQEESINNHIQSALMHKIYVIVSSYDASTVVILNVLPRGTKAGLNTAAAIGPRQASQLI